jgi:hypothetical protein
MAKKPGNQRRAPQKSMVGRRAFLFGAGGLVVAAGGGALLWPSRTPIAHAYALAPESVLTGNIKSAPPNVREAYRFAVANIDVLRQIPCFCNCGDEHKSNAECYIKAVKPDGSIVFDPMSYG